MDCFIGIDVAKATLDVAALPDGATWTVTNDEHGLAELAPRLVALAPVLVVLEATGGFEALAASALAHAGLLVAIINPRQFAHPPPGNRLRWRPPPACGSCSPSSTPWSNTSCAGIPTTLDFQDSC